MSNSVEITVKGKPFKLGFGLEVFISLGELWGLDTLEEVNLRFVELQTMGSNGMPTPLSVFKTISEIIAAMILANDENTEKITAAEIRGCTMLEFQQFAEQLTAGFVNTLPHPDNELEESVKKTPPKLKKKNL